MSRKGLHVAIPLDLSQYGTVEDALKEGDGYRVQFMALVRRALKEDNPEMHFGIRHMFLLSAPARAAGLHDAITREIDHANPHAVFPLLRTYVDLGGTMAYVNDKPNYIDTLINSGSSATRRGQGRVSPQAFFAVAATRYPGVKRVYDELSEFGHFGSSGVWVSWTPDDDRDSESVTVNYRLGPGWRDSSRDPLLAAAMLSEVSHVVHAEVETFLETYLLLLNRAWAAGGDQEESPGPNQ